MDIAALRKRAMTKMATEFTAKTMFLSGEMKASLETKLWAANRKWGIPNAELKVSWDEKNEDTASTDNKSIFINAGSPHLSSDDFERYKECFGLAAHESAHRRYTDFNVIEEQHNAIMKGTLYPSFPDDDSLSENVKKMKELIKDNPSEIETLLHRYHNIVEDGKIENYFLTYDKNLISLCEGLSFHRIRKKNDMPDLSVIESKVLSQEVKPLMALYQMSLSYALFGMVPGLTGGSQSDFVDFFRSLTPHIDGYKTALSQNESLEHLNTMFCMMADYIEGYLNSPHDADGDTQGLSGMSSDDAEKISAGGKPSGGTSQYGAPNSNGQGGETDDKEPVNLAYAKMKQDAIDNEVDSQAENLVIVNLTEYLGPVKDSKLHEKQNIKIIRPKTEPADFSLYKRKVKVLEPHIRRAVKLSTFYEKAPEPYIQKNRYFGTKFNAAGVARGDYKLFDKKSYSQEQPDISVALIVDESGSMSGQRISAAKETAIFIYEYCKRLGIKVSVIGHDESSRGTVNLRIYADSEKPEDADGARLIKMDYGGCNRDGVPIIFAKTKLLNEDSDARKLIMIISDGQPNADEYAGSAAIQDVQEQVKDCRRNNIVMLAAAIGSDKENIKRIYGEKSFLDISDITELPELMMRQIKALLY